DLQGISVAEQLLGGNELAVDEGAVAAAQVANHGMLIRDLEQAVLPTHQIAVGANVALRSTSEHVLAVGKRQTMSARLALDNLQAQLHKDSFRRQRAGPIPSGREH